MTIEEDIKSIEDEIRKTPYNKATMHHIGRLKAKLARLKEDLQKRATAKSAGKGEGYAVKRSGDATAVMVGFPSVGKSTLLNCLTGTAAEVAAYDFTTVDVIPGTLIYKGARVQFLDVPGLIAGAASGRGRGKEVLSVMRNADLILILVDVFHPQQYDILAKELYNAGIRINTKPPAVFIHKASRGGITVNSTVDLELDDRMIKAVLAEYKIHNAEVLIRERITLDDLIDVVIGNRNYIRALTVLNKIDLASSEQLQTLMERFPDAVTISAAVGINIEALRERVYNELRFICIYMKPQGASPDMENPLVIKRDSTMADVCSTIHREFVEKFRYARIWGKSVKYGGQRVGLSHVLADGDVVSIVTRR
ncbi:MAG TPA: GTP-binding protein [Candidatus Bathyarchaeia archaeon]|nr:GTP-binding protein [Candidatus Bathyarchaeia archaeon]